jgi:hypothetical protein
MSEDISLDSLEPSLWGVHVTQDTPAVLQAADRRLTVNRASLESGDQAQLFLSIKGEKYALGTLYKDKKNYTRLDIELFDDAKDSYELSIVGPTGTTVALTGHYTPAFMDEDLLSEEDMSDIDDEELIPALRGMKKSLKKASPVASPASAEKKKTSSTKCWEKRTTKRSSRAKGSNS